MPQPAHARPASHGGHCAGAAHGDAMAGAEPRASAAPRRPTGASGSGWRRGCSVSSGGRGCWPMRLWPESTGSGWRWMEPWGRHRLGGEKTGPNPTDRAKKGTKKSLLTDGRGAHLGLAVAGANVNDHKVMRPTLESCPWSAPPPARTHRRGSDAGYSCLFRRCAAPGLACSDAAHLSPAASVRRAHGRAGVERAASADACRACGRSLPPRSGELSPHP